MAKEFRRSEAGGPLFGPKNLYFFKETSHRIRDDSKVYIFRNHDFLHNNYYYNSLIYLINNYYTYCMTRFLFVNFIFIFPLIYIPHFFILLCNKKNYRYILYIQYTTYTLHIHCTVHDCTLHTCCTVYTVYICINLVYRKTIATYTVYYVHITYSPLYCPCLYITYMLYIVYICINLVYRKAIDVFGPFTGIPGNTLKRTQRTPNFGGRKREWESNRG